MSIFDKNLELALSQAVTASAISANVIDLAPLGSVAAGSNLTRDLGGEDLTLYVRTNQACTDAGSDATVTITLESDDNVGLTSATTHFSSGALPFAQFSPAATDLLKVKLPNGSYERYLGIRFTVASGPLTAGSFDAWITKDVQTRGAHTYRGGYSVV